MRNIILLAAAGMLGFTQMALAEGITISDAYARASSPMAKAGASFMVIENSGNEPDRLIAASSDAAKRVELHTHKQNSDGVMMMMEVEEGFEIPANGEHMLKRGGHHVMLMGLVKPLSEVDAVELTLTFEKAGDVKVTVPVDMDR